MFDHLQIADARERLLVGCADALLKPAATLLSRPPPTGAFTAPRRVLILRLERIGDLLMTLGAIEEVRLRTPNASIHLVVGSWNADLARLIPGVDSIEALDVPWLARGGKGNSGTELVRRAWNWRRLAFDLGINFEPDIRSNALLALSGAARRVGFDSGGGGALLTDSLAYLPRWHTAQNAARIVDSALPSTADQTGVTASGPRLQVPDEARRQARLVLGNPAAERVLIGVHASGGRAIKQWHTERFGQVASRLAREYGATIVFTGTRDDRALVDSLAGQLEPGVGCIDTAGAMDLPVFAGLLEQLSLFVTGDTGPMHLAAAVGTPVVAPFGPSDPARYGPLSSGARVVTTALWCRPCNRIRRPPARCTGHVPDCLSDIEVDEVCRAAAELLRRQA